MSETKLFLSIAHLQVIVDALLGSLKIGDSPGMRIWNFPLETRKATANALLDILSQKAISIESKEEEAT